MVTPISKTQLENASVDATSLEEFANGNSTKTVVARLGQTYPSIAKFLADNQTNINNGIAATLQARLINYSNVAEGDALIAVKNTFAGATNRTLHDLNEDAINAKNAGCVGNGTADDTLAINVAIAAAVAKGGGVIYFPRGSYRTTAIIDLPANVVLVGTGRRKAYPGVFTASANTLSTIVADHTGRCAFRITNATLDGNSNISFRDINLATLGIAGSAGPTAAVGFVCGDGAFQRDFTFERCGIQGFASAFDTYTTGSGTNIEMGVIKIINCSINMNNWIARTMNGTHWNSFVFLYNEAGQNGYEVNLGGIDIGAFAASIEYNVLEGQRNPVRLAGSFRGISVKGNYFENNVGRACIELKDARQDWLIGPNNYSGVNYGLLDQLVVLGTACGPGLCIDPYWPELVYKTPPAVLGADYGTGDNVLNATPNLPFARVDRMLGSNYALFPHVVDMLRQRVTIAAKEVSPQTGNPMAVQEYTTAGAGAVSLSYALPAVSGRWVVVCWLLKLTADASAVPNPYISINLNGTSAAGSRDFPLTRFGTYFRAGEWALITVATKAGATISSVTVDLYPHGTTPAAGRVSRFLRPVVYSVDDPNKIIPYIDNFIAESATAAPAAGTWGTGDFVRAATPAAGLAGYACSVGGTPGTWVNV